MNNRNPSRGNSSAMRRPKPALSPTEWAELHDYLTLALDALGDKPEHFGNDFLQNAVMHQRLAIKITHKALERQGAAQ